MCVYSAKPVLKDSLYTFRKHITEGLSAALAEKMFLLFDKIVRFVFVSLCKKITSFFVFGNNCSE